MSNAHLVLLSKLQINFQHTTLQTQDLLLAAMSCYALRLHAIMKNFTFPRVITPQTLLKVIDRQRGDGHVVRQKK